MYKDAPASMPRSGTRPRGTGTVGSQTSRATPAATIASRWRSSKKPATVRSATSVTSPRCHLVAADLGVDATGFVGGYLQTHYPAAGLTAESDWPAFLQAGTARETLTQVAALDLLVYPHGHVAIIDEVLTAAGGSVHCWVAESKGSADGGPQYHERWLSLDGRKFRIATAPAAQAEQLQAVLHPKV